VKSKVGFIAGLAALVLITYVGGRLVAQQNGAARPTAPAAAPVTKMAIFNLGQVIDSYKLTKDCLAETKAIQKRYQDELNKMTKEYEDYVTKMRTDASAPTTTDAAREQMEKDRKLKERKIADMKEEGNQYLGKMEAGQSTRIYQDIEEAVKLLARTRGLELVLQYNDVPPAVKYQPAGIRNRIVNPGLFPVYTAPGLDVTQELVAYLNSRQPTATAAPGAGH
jgi:Skp family chaperone for outer membrane proteins